MNTQEKIENEINQILERLDLIIDLLDDFTYLDEFDNICYSSGSEDLLKDRDRYLNMLGRKTYIVHKLKLERSFD